MKLLLTSAGIRNPSLHAALLELLGKPIEESVALAIPTASYGHPNVGAHQAWKFVAGLEPQTPMIELGWKSVGLLELAGVPSMGDDRWVSWVNEADVILVNGGDPLYLAHHMRESGLADLLRSWPGVYVGLSAGSMVMTPRIGEDFVNWRPASGSDETLGFVDFAIFPHLDHPMLPENTTADAERWAATMPMACYGLDDESAIRVVDGSIDVVSGSGAWKLLKS
jgi:dipeptidase E